MWEYLALVRIYTKPKGQLPDYSSPVVLNSSRYETSNLSAFQVAQISDLQYAKILPDPHKIYLIITLSVIDHQTTLAVSSTLIT